MKSKHPSLLVITVLSLTSCSIQTNMIHPDSLRYGPTVRPSSNESLYGYHSETLSNDPFPTISSEIVNDPKQLSLNGKKVVRKTLCAAFVVPPLPPAPRVDMNALSAIPADDHEAVKKLLIDNIRAMNDHTRKVEVELKEAYRKHRLSCATRDVLM